jgi:hypothetical protein|tara:strand:- start:3223 stop:3819 length:597 start_codon:yes stop_codon:yes gene_type:complete
MGEIRIAGLEYVYKDFTQGSTMEKLGYQIDDEDTPREFPEGSLAEEIIVYPQIELPKPLSRSQINFYRKGNEYGFSIVVSGTFKDFNPTCQKLLKRTLSNSDLEIITVQNTIHLAKESISGETETEYIVINEKSPNEENPAFVLNSGIHGARSRELGDYNFFEDNAREALSIVNGVINPLISNKNIPAHALTFTLSPL